MKDDKLYVSLYIHDNRSEGNDFDPSILLCVFNNIDITYCYYLKSCAKVVYYNKSSYLVMID